MVSKVLSAIPVGFGGERVWVECDMNRGLPGFNIVGLPNATVNEARDRVRSAIVNSKFTFPARKITINLAPAELKKDGTGLDLAIALAILVADGQISQRTVEFSGEIPHDAFTSPTSPLPERKECGMLFVGELSLSGEICAIPGVINVVEAARDTGVKTIFIPRDSLSMRSW